MSQEAAEAAAAAADEVQQALKRKRSSITLVKTEGGEAAATTTSLGVVSNGEIVKALSTARSTSLVWQSPPHVIAIIKRRGDQSVREKMIALGRYIVF